MDKVILIMDKPDCCGMCRLYGTGACGKWNMEDSGKFPKGCPLKPFPGKPDYPPIGAESFVAGWNACIDKIFGGGEDG